MTRILVVDGSPFIRKGSDGLTLAQNEVSCVVYGMPRAAHKRGAVSHVLSLPEICQLFAARSDVQ
jgi:chemotaxis response regulator CheB